jgi:FHS family glucose/mannose:H+ symporter-like MFS transporter
MGRLSDRFSPRRILGFGFLLSAIGLASSGFATSLGFFLILISITAAGVSTFHPVMYAIIDRSYPENKGRVMGIYESFGTGAILLMFLVNGSLFQWIGIRGVMLITALPGLVMGLAFLLSSDSSYSVSAASAGPATRTQVDRGTLRRFLLFLASIILRIVSVTAILNFLPTIFVRHFGFSESSAAYGTAFFFAGGIAGSLVAGRISSRFNYFGVLIVGSCLVALSILVFGLDLPRFVYPLLVALFGFFASGCIINQNLLMTQLGGSLGKGEVFGILMGIMSITSSFSPALFGLVIDHAGFGTAFLLFSIPVAMSMGILFLLQRDQRDQRRPSSSIAR